METIELQPMVLCSLLGCLITFLAIPVFLLPRMRMVVLQREEVKDSNLHHTHRAPVSRLGGLALIFSFVGVGLFVCVAYPDAIKNTTLAVAILGSSVAMFVLGFCDDLRPIGARKKLIGQLLIALAAYYYGIRIDTFKNPLTDAVYSLGPWSGLVTVAWLVAFTNLINLIDGIDGLAGGIALMLMALLSYVGFGPGLVFSVLIATGMAGALMAFLLYNFPPARIYMGDGGAYFLGFLIGSLTIVNSSKGTALAALVAPLFALALPIVDVGLAIGRRAIKGLPIFRPDRKHLHHRLVEVGFTRTRAVLILYSLSLVFLVLAFGVFWSQGKLLPILFGFMCLTLVISARSFSFSRDWFAVGRLLGSSRDIRKKTRCALALSRWLELEAEESYSAEALWADFTFLARKLGFTKVQLFHRDGEKTWETPFQVPTSAPPHCVRQETNHASFHALEFSAPSHAMTLRVCELLSELAAEACVKACVRWQACHEAAPQFEIVRQSDPAEPGAGEAPRPIFVRGERRP
jgi:UDP-GlcNAc:undecaprenyl-phosphate GlcNAc-1-phosphate transferase